MVGVDQGAVDAPLGDHAADIAAVGDATGVEGRTLPGPPGQHQVVDLHLAPRPQQVECPGSVADHDHPAKRRHAVRHLATKQERETGAVIADIGGLAIVSQVRISGHQDLAIGRPAAEIGEGFQPRRQGFQNRAGARADNRRAGELLPPAFALAVIHDEIRMAQLAGGAERQHLAADAPVENDGGVAQRAIGDRDRDLANRVIGDLVPG